MNNQGAVQLKRAADLIRKGRLNQARPILVEFLRGEPNSAQAWYLLSQTLADPQKQQYALRQALKADPEFEQAQQRLSELRGDAALPKRPIPAVLELPSQPLSQPGASDAKIESKPQTADLERDMPEQSSEPKRERGPGLRRALISIILVLLLGIIFIASRDFFTGLLANTNPTATKVVPFKTLPPTWTSSP